jgi:hypothetical protein
MAEADTDKTLEHVEMNSVEFGFAASVDIHRKQECVTHQEATLLVGP